MMPFRDLPIQRKLLVMTLVICGAVLFVVTTALFILQVQYFRSNFQRGTATLAAIIADNSTAALTFRDAEAGAEIIGSLQSKPTVVAAYLVLPDGKVFAHFGKVADAKELSRFPPPREFSFSSGDLLYTHPVELDGKRVGTLYLREDYRQTFFELLGFYGLVIMGVMTVSAGLVVFLLGRMRRVITDPVVALAETAQIVGEKQDYSVRAKIYPGDDELGRLTQAFNEMLDRIESQEHALKQSQEAELNLSREKLRSLIDSIDGVVWECTPDAESRFTFISRQAERILGCTPEKWLEQPGFWQEKLHPEDAARAGETRREKFARRQPYSQEYRMLAADGRAIWIRESGVVLVEKDHPVAVRGIFQDITEQKKAAEQLEQLNRKLVEISRYAGMAEVATGVLHNVGNVLTSVSVSATLVGDRLRRSKIANLTRATAMLRGQNNHLADYLTNDPKGKLLPEYLGTVADQLALEQAELIEEINALSQHIEHVKEIVAMQQSYARVSGAYENLSARALVEEALHMNLSAFERHHIRVVREFEDKLPLVCVDRHKVLQILINLLRNAKSAMEQQVTPHKRLVLRIESAAPDWVKIIVADNGIGIPPENLNKIFTHGFTTKREGHGFGLHSSANAAKEIGGRLTAHSDGPGHGSAFTLELLAATSPQRKETTATTKTL